MLAHSTQLTATGILEDPASEDGGDHASEEIMDYPMAVDQDPVKPPPEPPPPAPPPLPSQDDSQRWYARALKVAVSVANNMPTRTATLDDLLLSPGDVEVTDRCLAPPGSIMDWTCPFSPENRLPVCKNDLCGLRTSKLVDMVDNSWTLEDSRFEDVIAEQKLPFDTVVRQVHVARVDLQGQRQGLRSSSRTIDMLADSGSNINLGNDATAVTGTHAISPVTIGLAADGECTPCTHKGWISFDLEDGRTLRSQTFLNEGATDFIISPEAIMYSHPDIYRWEQQGFRGSNPGSLRFYDKNDRILLTLRLKKRNNLYYYEYTTPCLASQLPTHPQSPMAAVCQSQPDTDPPLDLVVAKVIRFSTSVEVATFKPEEHLVQPSSPLPMAAPSPVHPILRDPRPRQAPSTPKRSPAQRTPVTLAQQTDSETWAARMGFCGEHQLEVLPQHVEGTPNEFHLHPFRHIDIRERAAIRRQAARRSATKAQDTGQRWFMDFGFMRASTSDYSRPNPKRDRVVESYDGFWAYLLIVDEASRRAWVFLTTSKEPPVEFASEFMRINGRPDGGVIRCDQGGELARSSRFRQVMFEQHRYIVEPTGADSPSQNGGAERVNGTLAVIVRTLLYGSCLDASFWSAALLHAVYLYNRRVHSAINKTPFEAWYGRKPNLKLLRTFGARVCVRRPGDRRSKLDRHDFTGIFLGYTATDQNVRYLDLDTGVVKTSHHAAFDEAWYLQPSRPPTAQLLYDMGRCSEEDFIEPRTTLDHPTATYPPMLDDAAYSGDSDLCSTEAARRTHLPLNLFLERYHQQKDDTPDGLSMFSPPRVNATKIHPYQGTVLDPDRRETSKRPAWVEVDEYGISKRDIAQVYISPHPYRDSFEEELDLSTYNDNVPAGGMKFVTRNGRLTIGTMLPSTPAARIYNWRSRCRGAWLIRVDDTDITCLADVHSALDRAVTAGQQKSRLLFSHPEIKHGLTNSGIPQVNLDQLNPRLTFADFPMPTEVPDTLKPRVKAIWNAEESGVLEYVNGMARKLTRGKLLRDEEEWPHWQKSEWAQLDQYDAQGMFGTPVARDSDMAVFRLVWTYVVKELDKRRKARCTCDGSPRSGQARVLDYTYANCVDHTSSRLFYAVAAAENLLVYGADVTNAFGEAPPPKQGFFIQPDAAFRDWWTNKHNQPLPKGHVVPVLAAMQGHPEAPRLWEKHADTILRACGLTPTVHEPCLYSGLIDGERVLFMRQVDDFAVAVPSQRIANILFDMIDERITFPMKRMGLVTLFNGMDIEQTSEYIKVSAATYIKKIGAKYLTDPINLNLLQTKEIKPTPLPNRQTFMRSFLNATGDPDPKAQADLTKRFGFGYRNAIGELIYAMVTCRPDLSYAVVRSSQFSSCPHEVHFQGVRHMLKYLLLTKDDGIYFWRRNPKPNLATVPPPKINSNDHDLHRDGRPLDDSTSISAFVDSDWAGCPRTRRSFTGTCIRLAGGTIAYKSQLHPTVAQSSTEAEFMGACIPQSAATLLYEDNDACTAMANAQKPTTRTRHMDIKYHVLCEWVERDLIKLERVDTTINMADHFTKQLGPTLFHRHIDYIMGHVPPTYSARYHQLTGQPSLDHIETPTVSRLTQYWT
ncbi:hypothetical protein THAOC_19786 [Thalassiosira oceanica]|uniref:Integrase catalytic domain-containing protein n=1 Tax=Thalassiosira oceanica TaxID=159749 RepID=K0SN90_THAOC|nr:hypothetical protein THAOC_19786 [Thalassiosira oceanica]|eukprot:EJK59937.1 hypothetical protein THAOC_19786 [Thalassiosira oceanica]